MYTNFPIARKMPASVEVKVFKKRFSCSDIYSSVSKIEGSSFWIFARSHLFMRQWQKKCISFSTTLQDLHKRIFSGTFGFRQRPVSIARWWELHLRRVRALRWLTLGITKRYGSNWKVCLNIQYVLRIGKFVLSLMFCNHLSWKLLKI